MPVDCPIPKEEMEALKEAVVAALPGQVDAVLMFVFVGDKVGTIAYGPPEFLQGGNIKVQHLDVLRETFSDDDKPN